MSFDEINVIEKSKNLYKELDKINRDAFIAIANDAYRQVNPNTDKKMDLAWLLLLLDGYNEVTKYNYINEVDRKRSRFLESMLATRHRSKDFKTAMNLWMTQTIQYADSVTERAVIEGFKDTGVKYVMWNTQKDGSVCKDCNSRNGKIYPINKLPTKSHYRCRCYYTKAR